MGQHAHGIAPRRTGVTAIFPAIVAIVLLIVGTAAAAIFVVGPENDSASASFIGAQPNSLAWDGRSPVTALLIGSAASSGAPASALMVVSLDPARHTLHMLSIPSNLWVAIPGYSQGAIGAALADGGPRLQLLAVESITHVAIPYYAIVPDRAAQSLIDAVGGITVRVPDGLKVRGYPSLDGRNRLNITIRPGLHHLSGASALDYSRVVTPRTGGEIGAMKRQQRVLLALERQVLAPQNVFRIPNMVISLGGSFPTNFPYDRVPVLANVLMRVPGDRVSVTPLDFANQAVTSYAADGSGVLLADWYHVRSIARSMFPQPELATHAGLTVYNGSGVTGQAASLAAWLQLGGIPVAGYATAPKPTDRTEVVIAPGAPAQDRRFAASLAALLQVPVTKGSMGIRRGPVSVVIGRDYQDLTQP